MRKKYISLKNDIQSKVKSGKLSRWGYAGGVDQAKRPNVNSFDESSSSESETDSESSDEEDSSESTPEEKPGSATFSIPMPPKKIAVESYLKSTAVDVKKLFAAEEARRQLACMAGENILNESSKNSNEVQYKTIFNNNVQGLEESDHNSVGNKLCDKRNTYKVPDIKFDTNLDEKFEEMMGLLTDSE